jgi:hypothetical protein
MDAGYEWLVIIIIAALIGAENLVAVLVVDGQIAVAESIRQESQPQDLVILEQSSEKQNKRIADRRCIRLCELWARKPGRQ